MIYFDNAATGGYKPYGVTETAINVIKYLNANPGRSGHRLSRTAADLVYSSRKTLAEFFNAKSPADVIFTKNCTEGLNIAIHGTVKKGMRAITTVFEHNSVLRPLFTLKEKGLIDVTVVSPENGCYITANDVKKAFDESVYMVAVTGASNVTGAVNDISGIGEFLRDKNALYLVDGAQAAGHIQIDVQKSNINLLAVAGHKGMMGIAGSGALIITGAEVSPLMQGGTGTESFNPLQPDCYPERLEAGTLNLPAICSLEEGARYLMNNLDYAKKCLLEATAYLITKLEKNGGVKIYSRPNAAGIVAFSCAGISSTDLAEILSENYDIAVRGGFHCAPLCHKFLKTDEDGLVRVSLAINNTRREINEFVSAMDKIVGSD